MSEQEILNVFECSNEFDLLSDSESTSENSTEELCGSKDIPSNVYDWDSSDDHMPNIEIPKRQKKKAQKLSSDEEEGNQGRPEFCGNGGRPGFCGRGGRPGFCGSGRRPGLEIEGDQDSVEVEGDQDSVEVEGDQDSVEIEGDQDSVEVEGDQDSVEVEGDQDSVEEEEGDQGAPNDNEEPHKESDSESDDSNLMDIETISKLFRKKLKKFGISQRMAAKNILKCSQSTISELYAKASRLKSSKELSLRGRELYDKMQTWLSSSAAQKETQRSMIQHRAYSATPTPPRKKGSKAIKFSAVQMAVLVKLYRKDDRPATKKQQLIAEVLNLEIHQIRTWFNNQRARNFPAGKEHSSQNIPDDLDIFVNNY
ncbi:unnamed protein product [Mytilus edulis]|uniref:One cut domain family member n=1 Tax=Mytilus edulis TaxID=6550 RepID=A0A8S3RL99_MYTED|nr:unnamed protein product [Mytilus edulis]